MRIRHDGRESEIRGKAVVLASGGFEANPEWRTRYLGPGWDLAKVRGTRFNTGDGIRMALEIGASPCGNWSGCHAVQWEMNAPEFGDLAVGDQFQKHSYPFAILVNATGKRFVDEGADFRNYTYAKYGRVVLEQPGQFAWQVFDQKIKHLQRDEYRIRQITKVTANTIEEFAAKLEGVNAAEFVKTVAEWNKAVRNDIPFNPNVKDGRGTQGPRDQQVELGEHARYAALRRLRRDLRHHLHLRRAAREHRLRGAQHRLPADPRALRRGRAGRRHLLLQLSGRLGALLRLGVRQDRRHLGRPREGELMTCMLTSWPALVARPSTSCLPASERPARRGCPRQAAGMTAEERSCPISTSSPPPTSPRGIAAKKFTAEAVVRDCLDRIAAREPTVHALATIDPDYALMQARALDRMPSSRGALHGVPIGVKDIIDTEHLPTEMGSPIYKGHRSHRRRRLRRR